MASPGKGSQKKGADYERAIANKLKLKFGVDVKRTGAQERWKSIGGDVNAPSYVDTILNRFQIECKKRESWAILNWFKKTQDESGPQGRIPIVVASKNHEKDYLFMEFDDFIKILNELEGYIKEDKV